MSDTHVGAAGSRSYDNHIFHVLRADFLIRCRVAPASLSFLHLLVGQQWVQVEHVGTVSQIAGLILAKSKHPSSLNEIDIDWNIRFGQSRQVILQLLLNNAFLGREIAGAFVVAVALQN